MEHLPNISDRDCEGEKLPHSQQSNEHRLEIESHFLTLDWTALCSCGWRGPGRMSSGAAQADAQRHAEEVKGE